ncbi:hypothetical protein ABZW96_25385 [Nocardia sp. NPDC004168]|uniref:hypothetical protein n=1 Tax=Nocardia TaxID=1817 RepID=UPI00339E2FEF
MNADTGPMPESEDAAHPPREGDPGSAASDRQPDAEPTRQGALEVAGRSGRYTLFAALVAAVISSVVAAGSAVYVNIAQSDRTVRIETDKAVRSDRQKVYVDCATTLFALFEQLGRIQGKLIARTSREEVKPELPEYSRVGIRVLGQLELAMMVGSPAMADVAGRLAERYIRFNQDEWVTFARKYLSFGAPNESDIAEWEHDSAAMVKTINDFVADLDHINVEFIKAGRDDLSANR